MLGPSRSSFEQGLRQSGYVLGQNIVIDYRFAEGHPERLPALSNELFRTGIDVLFAANPHAIRAAIREKTTVPIVGIDLETDPVRAGWVMSLARPGGNITGFFLDIPELSADDTASRSTDQRLLDELLRVAGRYPDTVVAHPYYIGALVTGESSFGRFGYDVCPSVS